MAKNMIKVKADDAGRRIDNFLSFVLKKVPKNHIHKIIRSGEVRINGKRAKSASRINTDDLIRIPPVKTDLEKHEENDDLIKSITKKEISALENRIIYEDKYLLAIDKPSGLATHGGSGISHGLIEILKSNKRFDQVELIHRLDKHTSGCILIAKKRSCLRSMHELFRENKVQKEYILLSIGDWLAEKNNITVDAKLRKNILKSGERYVCVDENLGKESVTIFHKIKVFNLNLDEKKLIMLKAKPKTGHTHQIRAHAKHINLPILFDDKYGNREINKKFKFLTKNPRLFLHAQSIAFIHPVTQKKMFIEAKLDQDLESILILINSRNKTANA